MNLNMDLNKSKVFSGLLLAIFLVASTNTYASGEECTDAVITRVDNPVLVNAGGTGYGSDSLGNKASELTTCLKKRNKVKALVAWNTRILHKSGNGQQVINARNLMNDWERSYDMKAGENYKILIVAYGRGGRWTLNDEAFMAKYGTVNPSTALVESLLARGASVVMCQNTMKGNKWVTADLIPGITMVPAGVTALIDFQYQGYKYVSP